MRQRARALVGLVVVLLLLLGPARGAAIAEQPSGALYVTTLPAGADVWVDGTYLGRSPIFADALALGSHRVTITKTGWAVQAVDVEVKPGTTLSSIELTPAVRARIKATGAFDVRGLPDGAHLLLDGLPIDQKLPKPYKVSAGTHRVSFETTRGRMTRTFTVFPETTTEVVLREPASETARSPVVAPVDNYLPAGSCSIEGKKVVVRYDGHVVIAHLGEHAVRFDNALVEYDGVAQTIGGKLYLPLELLERLADADTSRSH